MLLLDDYNTDLQGKKLKEILLGMREALSRGENMMKWARDFIGNDQNLLAATLISYDLQAGSYIRDVCHART